MGSNYAFLKNVFINKSFPLDHSIVRKNAFKFYFILNKTTPSSPSHETQETNKQNLQQKPPPPTNRSNKITSIKWSYHEHCTFMHQPEKFEKLYPASSTQLLPFLTHSPSAAFLRPFTLPPSPDLHITFPIPNPLQHLSLCLCLYLSVSLSLSPPSPSDCLWECPPPPCPSPPPPHSPLLFFIRQELNAFFVSALFFFLSNTGVELITGCMLIMYNWVMYACVHLVLWTHYVLCGNSHVSNFTHSFMPIWI